MSGVARTRLRSRRCVAWERACALERVLGGGLVALGTLTAKVKGARCQLLAGPRSGTLGGTTIVPSRRRYKTGRPPPPLQRATDRAAPALQPDEVAVFNDKQRAWTITRPVSGCTLQRPIRAQGLNQDGVSRQAPSLARAYDARQTARLRLKPPGPQTARGPGTWPASRQRPPCAAPRASSPRRCECPRRACPTRRRGSRAGTH